MSRPGVWGELLVKQRAVGQYGDAPQEIEESSTTEVVPKISPIRPSRPSGGGGTVQNEGFALRWSPMRPLKGPQALVETMAPRSAPQVGGARQHLKRMTTGRENAGGPGAVAGEGGAKRRKREMTGEADVVSWHMYPWAPCETVAARDDLGPRKQRQQEPPRVLVPTIYR